LAFKNKKGFLEGLVMDSEPSLLSILNNIKKWMKNHTSETPQSLQKNAEDYAQSMKTYPNLVVDDTIIYQYGGGNMFKAGSFDRYTPFRNNPEADFLVMVWPMGLVQVSCNPFKGDRKLKGVNLRDIAQETLSKWEDQLKEKKVPLSTIKWVSEIQSGNDSVGFTFEDFMAIFGGKLESFENLDQRVVDSLSKLMSKKFKDLTEEEKQVLDKVGINAWDIIQSNSGGHKCITNISGLSYLGRSTRPPAGRSYGDESEDSPHVKFTKMIGNQFRKKLKEKIDESNSTSI
jgi:hypothetical protein